ncbi:MAG: metallophosphoesterase [Bacteroidota bacterium]|jgi:predicted MPP superfamily phosphohydrolase
MAIRFALLLGFFLLLDWYFYQAVSTVTQSYANSTKNLIKNFYWGFTVFSSVIMITAIIMGPLNAPKLLRVYVFAFIIVVEISKLVGVSFILIDDIIRLFRWILSFFQTSKTNQVTQISRIKFLQQMALGIAAIPFASLVFGMLKGAFDYRVKKIKLSLPNLPATFNGLKIVQISDIHTGSFTSTHHLEKAIEIIHQQKPDVIFFTGDIVNDKASELEGFSETFKKIKAPLGVFSTLGNHDYGDYVQWESAAAKQENLEKIQLAHHEYGWKLLNNEHHVLEKEGEKIAILGVENWGGNLRFPKYGKIEEAHLGTENIPIKLLLSHDPSHWDGQINKEYKDIDVMFSGHTHGMQFGIEIPGFKWSPSQYLYKQWAGLYKKENQYLYVNRGLGFIGYPGRVGILPEITVVELFRG